MLTPSVLLLRDLVSELLVVEQPSLVLPHSLMTLGSKVSLRMLSAATTFLDANSKVVLELDLLGSTTYSYAMQPASIGIVSFKNMPADSQGGATVTVLFLKHLQPLVV